ncbi:MAG TPA: Gfo/Idh/MocA family oxidoreductase [Trueperaceae bacterium]|nr:Gfo/Idh/MocA family oxidoreductase [Trueperaceae bacterium]
MKVGVIGICGFGRFHAEAFEELGWTVAAGADRSAELDTVTERFGAQPYRDYRELLKRPDLDAVSVSLPPRLHPEVVIAAREAGLPVFCEKPVAPSGAAADDLLRIVGEDAPVAVGFSLRYNPAYRRLRELMHTGQLGRVRAILARKCWGTSTPWRLQEGGGAVFVKDIHYFDLIPWLLDSEPSDVCAFGGSFYHQGPVEDSYQLLMQFPMGATFHLDSAWWTLPVAVNHFEVVGDRARVAIMNEVLHIEGEGARTERPEGERMVLAEIRAFTDWLAGAAHRPPGLVEAAKANRLAQQVADRLRSSTQ